MIVFKNICCTEQRSIIKPMIMQLQYSRQSYKMSMALFRLCYYLHKQFSHPFSSIIYIIKYREEIAISSYVDEKTYHSIIISLYNIRYMPSVESVMTFAFENLM